MSSYFDLLGGTMKNELHDPMLSDHEAAPVVGASKNTLKQSRHTGLLFGKPSPTFIKCGRSARYKLSALIEFRDQFPEYNNTSEY